MAVGLHRIRALMVILQPAASQRARLPVVVLARAGHAPIDARCDTSSVSH